MESTVLRSVAACALLSLFASLAAPAPAHAQSSRARVRQLNQEGMAAFHELDLERGEALLAEALVLAEREHVDGTDLARIHLSLGVIAVAGYSDSARGVESFMRALQIDPGISPDPMTSTPEIQSVFQLARTRLASGGRPPTGPAATRTTTTTVAGASIVHEPPTEQTLQTPLPIYVELRNADRVVRTVVMYRAHGMRRYRELALAPMGRGFGVEIPCDDVFEGDFAYYVIAFDASDRSVAAVASATAPLHVRIVPTPTAATAALALPGRPAPRSCATDECPPGMDCGGASTSASSSPDANAEEDESAGAAESRPRFFVQVGGVLGAYRATSGMQTDSPRNPALTPAENAGYVAAGDPGCDSDPGTDCVRVTQSGVLPVFGARLMVGYWVAPRWAIAVGGRVGPGGGKSALSFAMLQFRIQALLSKVEDTRFHAALTFGTSLGQVQVQPEQAGAPGAPGVEVVRPWAQVGLGSVQLGTILGYRFADHFGLFAQLDGSVFYRRFNVGADFTLGLELDF